MTTISGTGSASSAWSEMSSARTSARAAKMFAKVDADGSGSVDKTELQGMLDHIAEKSGNTLGSADELMTKMDADGDGSLSQSELDAGMKSLMPAPSSTVDFAQQSQGIPPPPPPDDALNDALANLFAAADTDGDKTLSQSEADALKAKMDTVVQGLQDSSSASSTSASTGDASGFSLSAFVDLVLKQYAQGAATSASTGSASSLSVSA